jgi:broad specificity phosphatase PhoE
MIKRSDPAVIFVRHAETSANIGEPGPDLVKGTQDYPLDAKGLAHSEQIARAVAKFKPSVVMTSPLERAAYVARAIGDKTGAPVVVRQDLLPPDFGNLTGREASEGEPKISAAFRNRPDAPMGVHGDAPAQWLARAAAGTQAGVAAAQQTPGPVVQVTHSRNLRELPHFLSGAPVADPAEGGPEPGQYQILRRDGKLSAPQGR